MKLEQIRILLMHGQGLIINGSDEFQLRPVIKALNLEVIPAWRVRSTNFLGHDCALVKGKFFRIERDSNSREFVDLSEPIDFPDPVLGCVIGNSDNEEEVVYHEGLR